jgi:hypothetical protein
MKDVLWKAIWIRDLKSNRADVILSNSATDPKIVGSDQDAHGCPAGVGCRGLQGSVHLQAHNHSYENGYEADNQESFSIHRSFSSMRSRKCATAPAACQ